MTTEILHEHSDQDERTEHNLGLGTGRKNKQRAVKKPLLKRIVAIVMMTLLALGTAIAVSSPAQAAEDDTANYSFYKLSSSLTAFFSNAQSPDEKAKELKPGVWDSITGSPGNAGSMLGYVDKDFSFSLDFLSSQISGSSAAIGYSTLISSSQGGGAGGTKTPGMLDYAHFGAALNAMGLDSMGTGLSVGFLAPLTGGLMMLFYIMTGAVDMFMTWVISMLQAINPFRLFQGAVTMVSPELGTAVSGGKPASGVMSGAANFIGDWYKVLNDLSWAIIVPLFIATLLFGLLFFKNMNRGSAIKKLCIRLVFIGVGLPLVGSMYTSTLTAMGDDSKSGSAGATQVVLSTYVDFETWAFKNRLAVPDSAIIEWDAGAGKPSGKAVSNVRNTALEINKQTNSVFSSITSAANVAEDSSWTQAALGDSDKESGGVGAYMRTIDILARYMGGVKLDAATFETAVKGDISTSAPYTGTPEDRKKVSGWFADFSDPKDALPKIDSAGTVAGNPVLTVASGTGLTSSALGATSGVKKFTSPSQWGCQAWVSNASGAPLNCNMSVLGVYNYLNTSFGADSMTMYSSNKSTSGATREMHNSVTQVGTGVVSGLYWVNSMVLLGSFIIIGLGYAFALFFSNMRRGIQLITAIPFATIGAMAGIAKVIIYSIAMILEVIMTLFVYRFIQVFLISLPQIIEMPFSQAINAISNEGNASAVNLVTGGTLGMTLTMVSIISLIAFTVLALRVRKVTVSAINEVVTKLVDKFMDTNVAPPGGGGMMPALASGAATGLGMAAGAKMMGGSKGGGAPSGNGGGGVGPAAVSTGGMPSAPGGPGGQVAPDGKLAIGGGADISGALGADGGNGPDGNGAPGGTMALASSDSPLALTAGSQDEALASSVEARGGLSGTGGSSTAPAGPDAADTLEGASDKAMAGYKEKDKAMGKAGVKAVEAGARIYAGDVQGGAQAAMEAGQAGQQAQNIQNEMDAPAPSSSMGTDGGSAPAGAAPASAASAAPAGGSAAGGAAGLAAVAAGGKGGGASAAAPKPAAGAGVPKGGAKPSGSAGSKPAAKASPKPAAKPVVSAGSKAAPKASPKPAAKAAPKPAAKPVVSAGSKAAPKASPKPAAKAAPKLAAKPATRAAASTGSKPAAKRSVGAAPVKGAKPAVRTAAPRGGATNTSGSRRATAPRTTVGGSAAAPVQRGTAPVRPARNVRTTAQSSAPVVAPAVRQAPQRSAGTRPTTAQAPQRQPNVPVQRQASAPVQRQASAPVQRQAPAQQQAPAPKAPRSPRSTQNRQAAAMMASQAVANAANQAAANKRQKDGEK